MPATGIEPDMAKIVKPSKYKNAVFMRFFGILLF